MTQTDILLIILVIALLVILVLSALMLVISVWGSGYKFWRKKKGVSARDTVHMERMTKLADDALAKLHCDVSWTEDGNDKVATYDYQNGHFRLRVTPGSLYVDLCFYFCFSTSVEKLHLVRTICNQCNLNTSNEKVVYSVNDQKNEVDVHILSGVQLHRDDAKDVLADAMAGSFSWQNAFVRRFREVENEQEGKSSDVEMSRYNYNRELFLLRQQELRLQDDPSLRMTPDNVLHLDTLLDKTMGINEFVARHLVVDGATRQEFGGHDAIVGLNLAEVLQLDDADHFEPASMMLAFDDPRTPGRERLLSITVNPQGNDRQASYFRFTLCLVPLPIAPGTPYRDNVGVRANSVLIGIDKVPTQQLIDESNYMWKEAREKLRQGEADSLTDEQKLICECTEADVAQLLYIGKKFFVSGRYYEALPKLETAFHRLNARFHEMKGGERDAFFEVCYLLGFVYVELKQYDRAMTYLGMTSNLRRINYTEELINCMVNWGDFRSLDYIDSLLDSLNPKDDPDDDNLPAAHILGFIAFLNRRKVFVLVEKGEFEKAKAILNTMLDDPENADYAINELAYIQKMEKNTPPL